MQNWNFIAGVLCVLCVNTFVNTSVADAEEAANHVPPASGATAPAKNSEESISTSAEIVRARFHFERGLQLVRQRHWLAALAEFDASLEAHPSRSALLNRGVCLRNLYRYTEAIEAFEQYLTLTRDDPYDPRRNEVRGLLAAMRELLTPVEVRVNRSGAALSVDGMVVGESPLARPLQLLSGPHEIEARLDGFLTSRQEILVVANREMVVELELRERPRLGRVRIESNVEEARVRIDGDEVGTTPYSTMLTEGEHQIELSANGHRSMSRSFSVVADQDHHLALTLAQRGRLHRGYFWSAVGVAIAGALATIGLGATVLALDSEYDPDGSDAQSRWNQGRAFVLSTDIVLAFTLATAVTGLVFYFYTDWSDVTPPSQ